MAYACFKLRGHCRKIRGHQTEAGGAEPEYEAMRYRLHEAYERWQAAETAGASLVVLHELACIADAAPDAFSGHTA